MMMRRSLVKSVLGLSAGIMTGLSSVSVLAAERVSFVYNAGSLEVLVSDLETLVKKGEVTPTFTPYADILGPNNVQKLRKGLIVSLPINTRELTILLQRPLGQKTLTQFAKLIDDEPEKSRTLLMKSLIAASQENQGLTLLNLLKKYPQETLPINIKAGINTFLQIDENVNKTDLFFSWVKEQMKGKNSPRLTGEQDLSQGGSQTWTEEKFQVALENNSPIEARVYLPKNGRKSAPLVVVAPGLNSNMNAFNYISEHLASHGFGVVAINFPDTDSQRLSEVLLGLDKVPEPNAWLNQPKYVSMVLDAMEEKVKSNPNWRGKINLNNVGILGHSLGGYTSIGVGGAELNWPNVLATCEGLKNPDKLMLNPSILWQCKEKDDTPPPESMMRDQRIKSVLAINPVTNPIFSQEGLEKMSVPVMIIAGNNDYFSPALLEQVRPFTWLKQTEKYLVLVKNSTHLSFSEGTENLSPNIVGPTPSVARSYLKVLSLAFFNRYLHQQSEFENYLTSEFATNLSQPSLPLSLLSSLTPEKLEDVITEKN